MGRIQIVLDDGLEEELRKYSKKVNGDKRGNLSKTVSEAIGLWLEVYKSKEKSGVPLNKRMDKIVISQY